MNNPFSSSPLERAFARVERSVQNNQVLPPNASDANNPPLVQIDDVHPSQEIENASQSNEPDKLPKTGTKRRVQQVSTKQARKTVLQWMENWVVEQDTDKGLMAAAIKQFPDHFRASPNANIKKSV
ncbi:hypothetical protein GEMRC1_004519 [Eukaryota sp. GEM-RC1]